MSQEALECRLRQHVSKLSVEIGERNVFRPHALHAAADYIRAEWCAQGYRVESQSYTAEGVMSENLEITRAGRKKPEAILLIGAHYDSVMGSPGANDNGSGVAALLEVSRFVAQLAPEKTVRLVAFVNEEPPFFYWGKMGSLVYAQAARKRGDPIELMMSLEMLGCFLDEPGSQSYPPLLTAFYPDRGDFIAFVSNLKSYKALRRAVAAFRAHSDFPAESLAAPYFVPGVGWSDQLSFWRQGYRAIMVTDTAFYRYRYYHTAQDTADKINYPAMARVVEGLQKAIAALAA
jgi:Zn-dependent M28 family amino/carboxypeptidase